MCNDGKEKGTRNLNTNGEGGERPFYLFRREVNVFGPYMDKSGSARNEKSNSCRSGKIYVYTRARVYGSRLCTNRGQRQYGALFIYYPCTCVCSIFLFIFYYSFFVSLSRNFPRLYYPIVLTVSIYVPACLFAAGGAARSRSDYHPAAKNITGAYPRALLCTRTCVRGVAPLPFPRGQLDDDGTIIELHVRVCTRVCGVRVDFRGKNTTAQVDDDDGFPILASFFTSVDRRRPDAIKLIFVRTTRVSCA